MKEGINHGYLVNCAKPVIRTLMTHNCKEIRAVRQNFFSTPLLGVLNKRIGKENQADMR